MSNSTALPLTGVLLVVTQLELVTPTTVAGTLYGIAFTLFCLYVHALAPRLREGDRIKQSRFMLTYSTVIMLCGLYYLVSNAWVTQDAYIKHSDYPYGPYSYILSAFRTTPVIPIGVACQIVIHVCTAAIQIWRVWVIWSATRYAIFVTVPPALCLVAFTALWLRTLVFDITLSVAEIITLDNIAEQAEIAIQTTITILCTVLISLYLIFKQWQHRKLIGKSQGSTGYATVVAMIVESYALESMWFLITIILWGRFTAAEFFLESVTYIEIIAYLLVQYRVASGKAYESQMQQRNISSLRWNHSNHATNTMQFGEGGEIQERPYVPAVPEGASVPQVSSMA